MYLVKVYVTFKKGILDPQGVTIQGALEALDYKSVRDVRTGKYMELRLEAPTAEAAREQAEEMARRLLANPVIEDYRLEVEEAQA
ncbi:MAG TPA: phosphoribosylformylglycinamidine synthase subunit PurS [Firmicutes bacterium]|uniref:phosphoribosylformylglycinamidine synthase subunit PurS n=1 Tax=Gelria sp. Kuro-4 TaxID=2796927 RepID=UPI0019CC7EF2|nr:phosphoribosylformylglycinamidine synthase subunit PurS [Gelria sp. Kuro-4]HHV57617.1 phosphoribosylformylglycinamidine synthase subunit PurS [Bacillota bacterium]